MIGSLRAPFLFQKFFTKWFTSIKLYGTIQLSTDTDLENKMKITPIEVKKLIDTEEISECFESFLEDATEDNAVYLAQKIIETYLEKNQ
ncbi:hypothetical protein [Shigella phage ESh36]|nr:hypothetical protein [Shigella phage ESh36]